MPGKGPERDRDRPPPRAHRLWPRNERGASLFVTVAVALFTALAGAAASERLVTGQFSPAPTETQASTVAEAATGQRPRNVPGRIVACQPAWCPKHWQPGGDQVAVFDDPPDHNGGVDHATVVYWIPLDEAAAVVDQARQRLVSAGWSVVEVVGSNRFTADKGDLEVFVYQIQGNAQGLDLESQVPSVGLDLDRKLATAPAAVAATTGCLAGLAGGWLLIRWVLRRRRQHPARAKDAILILSLPALLMIILVDIMILRFVMLGPPSMPMAVVPAATMAILGTGASTLSTITVVVVGSAISAVVWAARPSRAA